MGMLPGMQNLSKAGMDLLKAGMNLSKMGKTPQPCNNTLRSIIQEVIFQAIFILYESF